MVKESSAFFTTSVALACVWRVGPDLAISSTKTSTISYQRYAMDDLYAQRGVCHFQER